MLAVERHGAPNGRLTRRLGVRLRRQYATHTEAARLGEFLLDVEHCLEKGQTQLVARMCRGAGPAIFEAGKAILRERGHYVLHMLARELEQPRDTLDVPAFGIQPHHGPPRTICIVVQMKGRELEG